MQAERVRAQPHMQAGRLELPNEVGEGVGMVHLPDSSPWTSQHRPSLAISERRLLLLFMDMAVILFIGFALSWDRYGPGDFPGIALPLAVVWVLIGQVMGIYDLAIAARPRQCFLGLTRTAATFGLGLTVLFIAYPFVISRPKILMLAIGAPIMVGIWRAGYIRFFGAIHFQRRVLVIGAGAAASTLLGAIHRHPGHGISVVGLLDDNPQKIGAFVHGIPVLGDSSRMWPIVSEERVEEVVLAINQPPSESVLQSLGACYEHSIAVSPMPLLYEEVTGQVPVEFMGPHWIGSVQLGRTGGGISVAVKRLVDIVFSGTAILLTLPFTLLIALIIKLSSRGPVFHRQERIGLHGKPFQIVKFRTMRMNAERPGEAIWATQSDPRVTGVGRWLRKTHLDELPQLFLVVKGDMSLVGPRPERPQFDRNLEESIPLYRARYSVRPGLTGWAQLNYPYGASVEDALAKLRYDLFYVKHKGLILDTSILTRTLTRFTWMRGR